MPDVHRGSERTFNFFLPPRAVIILTTILEIMVAE